MRGFILQPTYRIEAGRAVVHLFGRLESGEPFLVRDDRTVPCFYVRAADAGRAGALGAERVVPSEHRALDGAELARVELAVPPDAPPLRDRLLRAGIACYEADVRFATKFLIERGIRGSLSILDGAPRRRSGVGRVFHNPELAPCDWTPELRVLSIDIETDPRIRQLLSIALSGCGAEEVLLWCPNGEPAPSGAIPFAEQRELLRAFCRRVRELGPDVLTGWNVVDFDFRTLERMAKHLGLRLELARGPGVLRLREARGTWSTTEAVVPGRLVLDGIQLLRGAFVKMERYGLDAVAREVLGEGKTIHGGDRAEAILDAFRHHRERFVEYNLKDARLVLDILDKLHLIELSVERSRLTGLPPDRVSGAIAAFDFLYLSQLHRRKLVAPSVGSALRGGVANLGGHVLEPEPGLYKNVLVLDFKSLYPSLIRTFQIDPVGFLPPPAPADIDPIRAPNGAAFRRQPGILPQLLDELFPRREAAKAAGDNVASHAIKILMNSFYGVLGTSACRFYRPEVAGAITAFGRELLLWSKARIESYGHRVLYGDTDSLFVLSGREDPRRALALGKKIVTDLNRDVGRHIADTWRVESRLELELERLYRQLFLPPMRHSQGGARKRYVGMVGDGEEAEVVFTGMEVVRRDWTELAKRVQRELYQRLFTDRQVEDYLELVVKNLRGGRLDDLLIYRKGLRKDLAEYTKTTPPHVAAARKLVRRRPGRTISFIITEQGPEPAEERRSPIDHEHYVQKQVRPVAEPVLAILGLDFDKVIGDDAQLELF